MQAKIERILNDLRSRLETPEEGESWAETVEDAMNTAWDELLRGATERS